jgi:asparagine synthase (glutamine-hydrolysing)
MQEKHFMIGTNIFLIPNQNHDAASTDDPASLRIINKPYPDYPLRVWQTAEGVTIFFEGYFGESPSHAAKALDRLASIPLYPGNTDWIKQVRCIQKAGGEFACWVLTNDYLLFFNDPLARLPVYRFFSRKMVFFGRSLSTLFDKQEKGPDRLGIAQTLWCGYSLGDRTLFEGVRRMKPGSIWLVDRKCLTATNLSDQKLGSQSSAWSGKAIQEAAGGLRDVFIEGCKQLTKQHMGPVHVSLSGGLDSRAALMGMCHTPSQVTASTFRGHRSAGETVLARRTALAANVGWEEFVLPDHTPADHWLLQMKQGLNYVGMAFIGPYLEWLKERYSGHLLITGDGGDKLLPYIGESRPPATEQQLLEKTLNRHAIVPHNLAAACVGLPAAELVDSLRAVLLDYEADSWNDRSVCFSLYERAGKAYFEGEDRNRHFLWSSSPFYNHHFFQRAMQVPASLKYNHKLYIEFLKLLSAPAAGIPAFGFGYPGGMRFGLLKGAELYWRSTPPVIKRYLRLMRKWLVSEQYDQKKYVSGQFSSMSASFLHYESVERIRKFGGREAQHHLQTICSVFS